MKESKCGTCGWVWERDGEPVPDEENHAALNHRLLGMVADLFEAMTPEERVAYNTALRIWMETGEETGPLKGGPGGYRVPPEMDPTVTP